MGLVTGKELCDWMECPSCAQKEARIAALEGVVEDIREVVNEYYLTVGADIQEGASRPDYPDIHIIDIQKALAKLEEV